MGFIIAIDGPAAAGKGTLSRKIAETYGFQHLDTGLTYRATAKALLDAGLPLDDEAVAERMALAVELASRHITVNCVAPGPIRTDMLKDAPVEEMLKMIPAARLGEADEVASLVAYLCGDDAAYITRQVIGVNGGMV